MDAPLTPEESHFAFRQARDMNRPNRSNRRSYRGGKRNQAQYRRREMLIVAQTILEKQQEALRVEVTREVKAELDAQTPRERAQEFVELLNAAETSGPARRFVAMLRKMDQSPDWQPTQEQLDETVEILLEILRTSSDDRIKLTIARFLGDMTRRQQRREIFLVQTLLKDRELRQDDKRGAKGRG